MKTLPGLGLALVLGLLFCWSGGVKDRRDRHRDDAILSVSRVPSVVGGTGGGSVFRSVPTVMPRSTELPAPNHVIPDNQDVFAMIPPAPLATQASAIAVPATTTAVAAPVTAPHSYGFASDTALASLSGGASAAIPTAHVPSFAYPTLPPKGIAIWGKGMMYREEKDAGKPWKNTYTHKGSVYSLGANYDWSMDSTIGLSADFLQAEAKGRYDGEARQTDTTGYFINAHYNGALCGKVPFSAKAMYGWLDQDASGWLQDWHSGSELPWNEEKHGSRMFGFSASAIYPLLGPYEYRVTPKLAIDYRNLKTKSFYVGLADDNSIGLVSPDITSTSFNYTCLLSTEKDFQQVWGVVTPRLSFGYSYEMSDSASGVRTLHASAAHRIEIDPAAASIPVAYDVGPKGMALCNVGVDMKILGGWDISAEYEKKFASDYNKDSFKLEIRRCF